VRRCTWRTRLGRLPEAWIAPREVRELREVTRYRHYADIGIALVYRPESQVHLRGLVLCIVYMSATLGAGFPADSVC
jgi:hypothetical protein